MRVALPCVPLRGVVGDVPFTRATLARRTRAYGRGAAPREPPPGTRTRADGGHGRTPACGRHRVLPYGPAAFPARTSARHPGPVPYGT